MFLLGITKSKVLFQCDELLFGKLIDCRPAGYIGLHAKCHVELLQRSMDFRRSLMQNCPVSAM